jgi:hypothetical protein
VFVSALTPAIEPSATSATRSAYSTNVAPRSRSGRVPRRPAVPRGRSRGRRGARAASITPCRTPDDTLEGELAVAPGAPAAAR